jgi:hypothetical protein
MSDRNSPFHTASLNLTREQIELCLAKGRRARSDAVFALFGRAFAGLRGKLRRQDEPASAGAYRLTWKAR